MNKIVLLATKPKRAAPKAKVGLHCFGDRLGSNRTTRRGEGVPPRVEGRRHRVGPRSGLFVPRGVEERADPVVLCSISIRSFKQRSTRTEGFKRLFALCQPACAMTTRPSYVRLLRCGASPLTKLHPQVFKSLIVLHTLLRAGSLDATFSYLASSSISLSLSSHEAPNIAAYAAYLAARIKSYGNLKRDVIRDKSDRRAAGRLRALGVEGGLLREVREVQRMISTLVESKVSFLEAEGKDWAVADLAAVLPRRHRRRRLHDRAATARQGPPRAVHCCQRRCDQRVGCVPLLPSLERH